jgi:hypothetical protein
MLLGVDCRAGDPQDQSPNGNRTPNPSIPSRRRTELLGFFQHDPGFLCDLDQLAIGNCRQAGVGNQRGHPSAFPLQAQMFRFLTRRDLSMPGT